MSGRLEGRVALVTGGARGQGAAEARLFAREGARVVIADVLADEGATLAAELGDAAAFAELDVSDERAWSEAVEAALERFGRLDALVNNAGVHWARPLLEETVEGLDRMLAVNLRGAFLGIRATARAIAKAGGGAIVNVSSTAGLTGYRHRGAYAMAKWGLRRLTRVAALELAPLGIRVNCVAPGGVRTAMVTDPDEPGRWTGVPARRVGEVEEIAEAVLFLVSGSSSYVTGTDLVVDGGALAG
jgi:3alpha(or 20beta)-hydroxysteroid dehydrogenase